MATTGLAEYQRGAEEMFPDPVKVYLHLLRDAAAVWVLIGRETSFYAFYAEWHCYEYPGSRILPVRPGYFRTAAVFCRIPRSIR